MWFIYVLLCRDGTLYTGVTNDVAKRFTIHQSGQGGKYTRSHRPVQIIYTEAVTTRSIALKREHEIKQWPRHKKITKLGLQAPVEVKTLH